MRSIRPQRPLHRSTLHRSALSGLAIAIAAGSLLLVAATPAAANSIGISPSSLEFDHALRGGTAKGSIAVFTDSTKPSTFSFQKAGDIAPWLTFFDANDSQQAPVDHVVAPPKGVDGLIGVSVAVPRQTPNGTYSGTVTVLSDANTTDRTAGAVNVGAQVSIRVSVTGTQVLAGQVLDASLGASEVELGQPLRIGARVRNTGNVDLDPDVAVVISAAGATVASLTAVKQPIAPEQIGDLVADWDTHKADLGEYTARITATAGSVPLGERSVNFRLVPEGSLTREGELRSLTLSDPASIGGAAKVVANFVNTGGVSATAVFQGDLRRNGRLIGQVTSPGLLVEPGKSGSLGVVVPTPRNGDYEVSGVVNFGGKETGPRKLTFGVGGTGGGGLAPIFIIVAVAGASLIVLLLVWRRRRIVGQRVAT